MCNYFCLSIERKKVFEKKNFSICNGLFDYVKIEIFNSG